MQFIRYLAWNMMVMGAFVLSHVYSIESIQTIASIFFAIEAIAYTIVVMLPRKDKLIFFTGLKGEQMLKWYKIIGECLCVASAFYLKDPFAGICMTVTFGGFLYLAVMQKEYLKGEANKEALSSD